MSAHIYLPRDQETRINSYLWTDIMSVFKSFVGHGSRLFGQSFNISEVQGREHNLTRG